MVNKTLMRAGIVDVFGDALIIDLALSLAQIHNSYNTLVYAQIPP